MKINNPAWVKLTPEATEYFREQMRMRGFSSEERLNLRLDSNGYFKDYLWSIMYYFGPLVAIGLPSPFENGEIYFTEPTS